MSLTKPINKELVGSFSQSGLQPPVGLPANTYFFDDAESQPHYFDDASTLVHVTQD